MHAYDECLPVTQAGECRGLEGDILPTRLPYIMSNG
jgi:hypothetical protein